MNLKDKIRLVKSKHDVEQLGKNIKDLTGTEELITIMKDDVFVARKAAWVLNHSFDNGNRFIKDYAEQLTSILKLTNDHALKRNILRVFQFIEIPTDQESEVVDLCFSIVVNDKEKVAARAFGLTVLHNLTIKYKELKNELIFACEEVIKSNSSGLSYRAKKILKSIS